MNQELVTFNELQTEYIKLYRLLRKYIWEYDVVEAIGEFEILIFTAFADRQEQLRALSALEQQLRRTDAWLEDETLQDCIDEFRDLLEGSESIVPLKTFKEMMV